MSVSRPVSSMGITSLNDTRLWERFKNDKSGELPPSERARVIAGLLRPRMQVVNVVEIIKREEMA